MVVDTIRAYTAVEEDINVRREQSIWAKTIDHEPRESFKLQDAIARDAINPIVNPRLWSCPSCFR